MEIFQVEGSALTQRLYHRNQSSKIHMGDHKSKFLEINLLYLKRYIYFPILNSNDNNVFIENINLKI